jgi:pilus assembly protein CpaB
MKSRGLVLVVALLVASAATAAVFMYVQSVRSNVRSSSTDVRVIVSKQDIAAGTRLDALIESGQLTTISVPADTVVPGAVTDASQIQGKTTSTFILAGEQITTARLRGSRQGTGGILGIPKGMQAVTVELDAQKVPAEVVQTGDHVSVYATFSQVSVISAGKLRQFLGGHGGADNQSQQLGDFTVELIPDAQVLRAQRAPNSANLGKRVYDVTLALAPNDGQGLVFAQEKGSIWLALLPPGEDGKPQPPVNYLNSLRSGIEVREVGR